MKFTFVDEMGRVSHYDDAIGEIFADGYPILRVAELQLRHLPRNEARGLGKIMLTPQCLEVMLEPTNYFAPADKVPVHLWVTVSEPGRHVRVAYRDLVFQSVDFTYKLDDIETDSRFEFSCRWDPQRPESLISLTRVSPCPSTPPRP